jgi:hypothetical protein
MKSRVCDIALVTVLIVASGSPSVADDRPERPDQSKKSITVHPEPYRRFAAKKAGSI